MSLQQSSFLFDYDAFQATATPLVAALDAGDPRPLQESVTRIRQKAGPYKNWVLHDKGTALWDSVSAQDPRFKSSLWGHWLLIVLSEFLHPCVSLGYDWTKLSVTLHSLKWSEVDVRRVFVGLPTVWLLKPEAPYERDKHGILIVEKPIPYWYLITPDRATYSGWLPIEEIIRLRDRLLVDHASVIQKVIHTQIQLPPNISTAKAHISPELDPNYWYKRIPVVYQQAIDMMDQAVDAGKGLLMVVYQEEGDADDEQIDGAEDD